MDIHIKALPIELQDYIRYLIPQFTRLSKTHISGTQYILNKAINNITKEELTNYLKYNNVDQFYIYIDSNNFDIDVYHNNSVNSYEDYVISLLGYKHFDKHKVCYYSTADYVKRIRRNIIKSINVNNIMCNYDTFYVDLFTAYQVKNSFGEYHHVVENLNKNFLIKYLDSVINKISTYTYPLNSIAKYYYVLHSYNRFYKHYVREEIDGEILESIFSDFVLEINIDLKSNDNIKHIEHLNNLYNILYKKLCNMINTFII